MKLIIDIPDKVYGIIRYFETALDSTYKKEDNVGAILTKAVLNGTPLPKGHGVLKDVTNLMRGLYTDMQTIEETFTSSDVYKMIDEECPTIIEAD